MSELNPITSYPALLGAVIVALREQKSMKQVEMAGAVGVGPSTWSRIERGESALTVDQLRRAAEALELAPSELLGKVEAAERGLHSKGIQVENIKSSTWNMSSGFTSALVMPVVGSTLIGIVIGVLAALNSDRSSE